MPLARGIAKLPTTAAARVQQSIQAHTMRIQAARLPVQAPRPQKPARSPVVIPRQTSPSVSALVKSMAPLRITTKPAAKVQATASSVPKKSTLKSALRIPGARSTKKSVHWNFGAVSRAQIHYYTVATLPPRHEIMNAYPNPFPAPAMVAKRGGVLCSLRSDRVIQPTREGQIAHPNHHRRCPYCLQNANAGRFIVPYNGTEIDEDESNFLWATACETLRCEDHETF